MRERPSINTVIEHLSMELGEVVEFIDELEAELAHQRAVNDTLRRTYEPQFERDNKEIERLEAENEQLKDKVTVLMEVYRAMKSLHRLNVKHNDRSLALDHLYWVTEEAKKLLEAGEVGNAD